MSNRVFIDTSFVVAVTNPRDQNHEKAFRLAQDYVRRPLLTTTAVLLEIGNMLAKNYKQEAGRAIRRFLSAPEVEVARLNEDLFERGLASYNQHFDKAWGLVDCISFVVMREAGIHQALAFDQHFVQAGFETL